MSGRYPYNHPTYPTQPAWNSGKYPCYRPTNPSHHACNSGRYPSYHLSYPPTPGGRPGRPPYPPYPTAPPSYPGYPTAYTTAAPTYPGSIYPSVPPLANVPSYDYQVIKPERPGDHFWIPPSVCTGSLDWIPSHGGQVPPEAVHAGQDSDGGAIYVGRAFHEGDLLPAKICPSHSCAFVSYGGQEIPKIHYEVLCTSSAAWKYARDGEYPPEAIRVGTTSDGEPLFVGRTMFRGTMTPGKVHPSHRCLYIPFAGEEVSFPEYEILILN